MNLKEKSIQYWESKLKDFEPKKGVTIMTSPERQKQFLEDYQEHLDYLYLIVKLIEIVMKQLCMI
jgi:hypothetical protein